MIHAGVRIDVAESDALAYDVDALVLKHAQDRHGVDDRAVEATGIAPTRLPIPGDRCVLRDPPGLAARMLVFVGVPPLHRFGYREIREFGYQALAAVAVEMPEASDVAVTLHGANYGLDEIESFDSELAGLLDAIREGDAPLGLRRVIFVERNSARARRMAARLEETLARGVSISRGQPAKQALTDPVAARFRHVGFDSAGRDHAFVAMPFSEQFEDVFHYGISNAVRSSGLLCERVDQQTFTGEVIARITAQIRSAKFVIADMTEANPNVYLEVGLAWGANVPTILLCKNGDGLKFDVQGQRCLFYANVRDLEEKLTRELQGLVG